MVGTCRKPFPGVLREKGSRRGTGLVSTEDSALGGSWRWEASEGRDQRECWWLLDREEDEELGVPIFGVYGSVDAPVVPEEKVRVDEKLGRGGDNWNADPESADSSEAGGVKAPKTLGRLKAHEP
jgi:hypothetical protein